MIIFGILFLFGLVWILYNITSAYITFIKYQDGFEVAIEDNRLFGKIYYYTMYGAGILFTKKVVIPVYVKITHNNQRKR